MKYRKFLVSFTYNTKEGFGFGNWISETDGGFVDIDNAKEYAEEVRIGNSYSSLVILAISEIKHNLTNDSPNTSRS